MITGPSFRRFPKSMQACVLGSLFLGACASSDPIVVHKAPPAVEAKIYDRNLTTPKSKPSAEANTNWQFKCRPAFEFEEVRREKVDERVLVEIRIDAVEVSLALDITIWMPENPAPKVNDHENGHVRICRACYANAELIARSCARSIIGAHFQSTALSEKEARQKAIDLASEKLASCYRSQTLDKASHVSIIYDQLTEHGQNDVPVDTAIKSAFKRYSQAGADSHRHD